MPIPYQDPSVNAVRIIVQNTCHATWAIYMETLVPVVGVAAIRLLSFGLTDVIRGYTRPNASQLRPLSTWPKPGKYVKGISRRGKYKRGRIIPRLPEAGSLIGGKLAGADLLKARSVTNGVRLLWVIDGVTQRLLWHWLVMDVIHSSIYLWSSAIYSSAFCQTVNTTGALRTGANSPLAGLLGYQQVLANTAVYEQGDVNSAIGSFELTRDHPCHMSVAASYTNKGSTTQQVELAISLDPNNPDQIATTGRFTVAPMSTQEMVVSGDVYTGQVYFFQAFLDNGFGDLENIRAFLQEYGPQRPPTP